MTVSTLLRPAKLQAISKFLQLIDGAVLYSSIFSQETQNGHFAMQAGVPTITLNILNSIYITP